MQSLEVLTPPKTKPPPGFRLCRVEIYNWGTFNGKVHALVPDGGWSLLVGENGSGKSTAVDALRTLLVPPSQLNYNDSSGEQKRRDRTKRSYVRGAWASSSQDDSSAAITQYLRGEGNYCVLLAVFGNRRKDYWGTIAQVLWEQGEEIKTVYVVVPRVCSIREHFSELPNTRDIRKELRRRGLDPIETFSAYSERFRRALGIQSQGALQVFNHAIGVKEVRDINQFIRGHMLEPSDALDFIEKTLRPHYKTLQDCWHAIQKAEAQIKLLAPIARLEAQRQEAAAKKHDFEELGQAVPIVFARRHLLLREHEGEGLAKQRETVLSEKQAGEQIRDAEQGKRDIIKSELDTDAVAPRLALIGIQLENHRKERADKFERNNALHKHLGFIGQRAPVESDEQLKAVRDRAEAAQMSLKSDSEAWQRREINAAVSLNNFQQEEEQYSKELENLRQNRVLIPARLVGVRTDICATLGIDASDLPFAGELIEVRQEFREWTGAIERLLHGFGVALLVPDQYYRRVAGFINTRHLGLRMIFHRVPLAASAVFQEQPSGSNRVCARVNVRSDHPLRQWMQSEVNRRFRHVCCASVAELEREDYGVTREGLVRDGPTRNIKDDRQKVDDAKNYILGWSTEAKIKAVSLGLIETQQRIKAARTERERAREHIDLCDNHLRTIETILAVGKFEQIDFRSEDEIINKLLREQTELEESSERRKTLKRQFDELEARIADLQKQLIGLERQDATLQLQLKQNADAQHILRNTLAPHLELDLSRFGSSIEALQSEKTLTLANIDRVASETAASLNGKINYQTSVINGTEREMLPQMTTFLVEYGEYRQRLSDKVEFASEFADLMRELENDDLPKHRKRFQEFLSSNLIGDMAMFNTRLEEQEASIHERLQQVNTALEKVPFSANTRVRLVPKPNRSDEIRRFRAELRSCMSGAINPTEDDRMRIFVNIRELIDKFGKDPGWTARVTDARNWLDFGVSEIEEASNSEVNYFSASSGKSGGQKTRLAFTILASAISAQYGLAGFGDESHTFRLVVIDEAFARTDEENSRQALDLFKSFGLQLLIVSPFDAKARIVEDYVDTFHLSTNPERNNSSLRRATRAEYDAAREERDADAA